LSVLSVYSGTRRSPRRKNYGLVLRLKATEISVVLIKNEERFASIDLMDCQVGVMVDTKDIAEISVYRLSACYSFAVCLFVSVWIIVLQTG
jgi:hypothetical protein